MTWVQHEIRDPPGFARQMCAVCCSSINDIAGDATRGPNMYSDTAASQGQNSINRVLCSRIYFGGYWYIKIK